MDYGRMKRIVDGNMEAILESRQFLYDVELTDKTKAIIRQALERAYNGGYTGHMYEPEQVEKTQARALTTPPWRPERDEVTHFATVMNLNGTETGGVSGSVEGVSYWADVYRRRGYNVKTEPHGDELIARWSKSQGMTPAPSQGR